ncbi:hypothetical protein ACA910_018169 [Epithemia clementina (nom. ined.)]
MKGLDDQSEHTYEGQVFAEPNAGFKNLLSRWHQLDDSSHTSLNRLPGFTKKEKNGSTDPKLNGDYASDHSKKKKCSKKKEHKLDSSTADAKDGKTAVDQTPIVTDDKTKETPENPEAKESGKPEIARRGSRQDLKEAFHKAKPSHATKKKALRQPVNVYQAAPEFTKDFKPPKFTKTDEEKDLIKKSLRKNFVFADLTSRELRPLVAAFEPCKFDVGEIIIKQGDPGDYFYIIQKGKVIFQVDGADVGKAGKGSSFGELALLYTCPRAATVVAAKPTKVFRVDQGTFHYILQNQTAESEKEKFELLRGVNFLKELDEKHLKKMTLVMTPRIFSEGDVLVKKGEPGDAFYVIQEGNVLVKDISVGHTKYQDLELGPGDHFGERALVTSEPRAANVVGTSRGVAFSIDRGTFESVLGGMEALVIKANDTRILSGISLFSKAKLPQSTFVELADLVTDTCYMASQLIMQQHQKVAAALYIVREGEVIIKSVTGDTSEFSAGEIFGQETMLSGVETGFPRIEAPYSVTAKTVCTLGALMLADCRYVFDVDLLSGKKKAPSFTLTKEELLKAGPSKPKKNIKLEDLVKKTILGAGSFGQVWLVSGVDEDTGEFLPYALKIQAKYDLHQEGQIGAVIREKQILSETNHPFIVNLVATYQDPTFVYFLTEFVQGGELFSIIHKEDSSGLKEDEAKFYALCIADAISHLHSMKIVYRDMKPENVLVDRTGYPKLIDFGFAKYCPEKTFTFCGTPGYVPPEIITKRGHDCTADNWSLGILLYEMLSGENPFYFEGMDQITLFRSIVEDDFLPLSGVSKEAAQIVVELLVKDPSMRLGSSKLRGFVVEHAWFSDIDVDSMRRREITPPWKPMCSDPFDAIQFDDWGDLADKSTQKFDPLPQDQERRFQEEF